MRMRVSNRQLLIVAILLASTSFALALGRLTANPLARLARRFPDYPVLLDEVDSDTVVNLTEIVAESEYTIAWVISTGCSRCDLALDFCTKELEVAATRGTPVYLILDDNSARQLNNSSDLFPGVFSYYTMRISTAEVFQSTRSPSCYLFDRKGRVLNRSAEYPKGWEEIVERLSLHSDSSSESETDNRPR